MQSKRGSKRTRSKATPTSRIQLVPRHSTIITKVEVEGVSQRDRILAITLIRESTGITWREWSRRCDRPFHFASIWRCAHGRQVVSLDTLAMLARAAGFDFRCWINAA